MNCIDVNISVYIIFDFLYTLMGQSVFGGVVQQCASIISVKAVFPTSEPIIVLLVVEDDHNVACELINGVTCHSRVGDDVRIDFLGRSIFHAGAQAKDHGQQNETHVFHFVRLEGFKTYGQIHFH